MSFRRCLLAEIFKDNKLNFINNERVSAISSEYEISVTEPSTGKHVLNLKVSGREDVDKAVKFAKNAFNSWSEISSFERSKYLIQIGQQIRQDLEFITSVETSDSGKPVWEARNDVISCAEAFEYFGGIIPSILGAKYIIIDKKELYILGQHIPQKNGSFALVCKEPFGVVGAIAAWNYPLQNLYKIAPALACGNTIVAKPSQFTPFSAVLLGEIMKKANVPNGVYNVIQGDGTSGQYLCQHADVDMLSLTGSVPTGQKVMEESSKYIRPVHLELGGKSPLIVFEDADPLKAAHISIMANFLSQGQVCSNGTRVFVHSSILDLFLERIIKATNCLKVGDPLSEDTRIGAIINDKHGEKILHYINDAQKQGAVILCGGKRIILPPPLNGGFYISPCVMTNCSDDMKITKDEVFGPVMTVLPFSTEEEVIQRANNTVYGLAAGIVTKDIQRAFRLSKRLHAGTVWINTYNIFNVDIPFGGYKLSGFGKEGGRIALEHYLQNKTVYVETGEIDTGQLFK